MGEPEPGFCTTFSVALEVIWVATVAGLAVGLVPRYMATAPATWGAAIDVPLSERVAVDDPMYVDVMATPGAKTSTTDP